MPKLIRAERKAKSAAYPCPGCGEVINVEFDGEVSRFKQAGKEFAFCSGIFEVVMVKCPRCQGDVEFAKDEVV
jgi:antirestriction protein